MFFVKQKTAYEMRISDWSSDVCSSDLPRPGEQVDANGCAVEQNFVLRGVKFEFDSDRLTAEAKRILDQVAVTLQAYPNVKVEVEGHTDNIGRSEERRVGKECVSPCRSRWSPCH